MSLGHLNTLSPGAAQVALHAALTVSLRPPVVTKSRGMSLYSNFLAVLLSLLFSVMTVVEFHCEACGIQ